jgi:hypothetical protein
MKAKLGWACAVLLAMAALLGAEPFLVVSAQDNSTPSQKKNEELHQAQINYAKALLKIAEADLAKAREANRKVADTIPRSVIIGLQNDVAMATARVKGMLGLEKDEKENSYVTAAQDAIAYHEEMLRKTQQANARVPGAISKLEIDRRQAELEAARARLEVARLMSTASPLEATEWELLQLQGDVHALQFRVQLLQERN